MSRDPSLTKEPPTTPGDASGVYGWDWSATTHDALGTTSTVREIVATMTATLGGQHILPTGKGLQGWSEGLDVFDCDGYRLGTVYYGGDRTDVHVVAKSSAADLVREDVTRQGAKTARVDTRVDALVPYEDLSGIIMAAASRYGSQITRYETVNPRTGETVGRTLYMGAPSSAIRVRLYEKWLESPGQYVEGTNRVEVQLRPASKVKERVSGWSRAETFCASKVTRDLASRLGADLRPSASLHVARATPDLERTLQAMGEQYGPAARRYLDLRPDDYDTVARYLFG